MLSFKQSTTTLISIFYFCYHVAAQSPTCNVNQITQAMAAAGFQPLNVSGFPCALYYFNPTQTNSWLTAKSQADAVGATLVTINNQAENDAVQQAAVAAGVTGGVWIGYTDRLTEGTWLWEDGSTASFTNWNPGEPNNSSCFPSTDGEDGAIIQMSNGRWNDVYLGPQGACLASAAYASLVKVNLCPQVSASVPSAAVCENTPANLTATGQFGSLAYTYSWFALPNPVSIGNGANFSPSPAANTTYVALLEDRYGCSDTAQVSVTTQICSQPVTSCNIPLITQTMAAAGFQPLSISGFPCALYYFNPTQTNSWLAAKAQADAVGATLVTINNQAENDAVQQAAVAAGVTGGVWIGYTDRLTEGTWLWEDGSSAAFTNWNPGEPNNSSCFGSSDGEDGAIIQMSNGRWNDVYLGPQGVCLAPASYASLVKVNLCPEITVTGPSAAICEGTPTSLSATTLFGSPNYTYSWNNGGGAGNPVNVSPLVNTTYTVTVADRYACSDTASVAVTVQQCTQPACDIALVRSTFQAAGYTEMASCTNLSPCSMYFLNPNNLDGSAAQTAAQQLGTNLVSIQSATENTCLTNWLTANAFTANDYVMIGLNDITTENTFVWYDQNPLTYTNWQNGEPNNSGNEDCVQLRTSGVWNDIPCGQSNSGSIIEVNLCPQITVPAVAAICSGQQAQLTASTILGSTPYVYSWDNGAGTGSPVSVTPLTSTTYNVTVTDRFVCTATGSVLVDVLPGPTTTFTVTSPICAGQTSTITYTGNASANAPYTWDFDGGTVISGSGQGPYQVSWAAGAVYNVTLDIVAGGGACNAGITTVPVIVNAQPVANAGVDTTVCSGGTLPIGSAAVVGETYLWTPATNLSSDVVANPNINGTNSSAQPIINTYFLTTTSAGGCSDRDTVVITINAAQPLNVTASGNTQFCEGQSVTLTADPNLNNYTWQDTVTGAIRIITSTRSYIVTAEDAQGCEYISPATAIIVFDKPIIDTANLTNISCFGLSNGSADFTTTDGTPTYQYFESINNTPLPNNTLSNLAPGNYEVYVIDGAQCADTITFDITEPTLPLSINLLSLQNVTCFGFSDGNINVEALDGTPNYTFNWSNGNTSANNTALIIGDYFITVTDNNGCTTDTFFTITQPNELFISIEDSLRVLLGESILLNPQYDTTQPYNFSWQPDVYLDNASIATPNATPFTTTFYTVTLSDSNNCFITDSVTIYVTDSILIYIPNIFSPNNDNVNDRFNIYANAVKDFYLIIYNRWGEKVFESKDITQTWDGNYKGKEAEVGVYVYQVQFTFLNFTKQKKKGSITLVR